MQIREAAMKAVVTLDHSEKWKSALRHRGHSEVRDYHPGEWVYYWQRQGTKANIRGRMRRDAFRWHGPAIIIGREWDHRHETHSYWVSHSGMLKLIVQQHLRPMLDSASKDLEKLHKELDLARQSVRPDGGPVDYEDLTQQRPPPESATPMFGMPAVYGRLPTQPPQGTPRRVRRQRAEVPPATTPDLTTAPPSTVEPHEGITTPRPSEPTTDGYDVRVPSTPTDSMGTTSMPPVSTAPSVTPSEVGDPLMPGQEMIYVLKERIMAGRKKGRELDPRQFDANEWAAFAGPGGSDEAEWKSWLASGAVRVVAPKEAAKISADRVFARPARYVRTNKAKDPTTLMPKSRIVFPGDVDVDSGKMPEDGGFRTDSPTAPQVAFHLLCSEAAQRGWKLGSFDVKTAFLSGEAQSREIYVRPPKDGLPGVPECALLQPLKGVFGLKEAPRLWYLAARKRCKEAGLEELRTAKSTFVVRNSDGTPAGMLVLHVDDGCWGGDGPTFRKAQKRLRELLNMGKEETGSFIFLGRHLTQHSDGSVYIHQDDYIRQVETIYIPKTRRSQPEATVTEDERRALRALLGKLIWVARQTMPQIAYDVSDLQQRVTTARVTDLVPSNCCSTTDARGYEGWIPPEVPSNPRYDTLRFGSRGGPGCEFRTTARGRKPAWLFHPTLHL